MSNEILEIIECITNGSFFEIANIKMMIENIAKRRMESRPQTRFTLTIEQEIKQIILQIRGVLKDRAEEYPIVNPEQTINGKLEIF